MLAVNLLSTENATKLPKCSKRLHFCASLPSKATFHRGENTADTLPVMPVSQWVLGSDLWFTLDSLVVSYRFCRRFGPSGAPEGRVGSGEPCMNGTRAGTERRKWARLPLAIPVFVRSRDDNGKEFLEFATALNVSAGGMLVAIRRVLPAIAQIRLEIPSAPVAALALLPKASRTLRAKALRTTPAEGYYLLGLKFARPLLLPANVNGSRRKVASAV